MRLEVEIDGGKYWIDLKDRWTQRDRNAWARAGTLEDSDLENAEKTEAAIARTNTAKLVLLRQWSTGCFLTDADGEEFHSLDDVTAEDLDGFDASLYRLVLTAPTDASAIRARLGEPKGRRS